MASSATHLLLVNPSSGGGRTRKLLPEVEEALQANGIAHRTVLTKSVAHGCEEAKAAAAAGEVVVVMSGDGLIGQVGGALAETRTTFGVIPGGRGNDFARALGIPTAPAGATALLAAGTTRDIDVGEANGKRFVCIASCGFDSDANRIANETRMVRGNLVYLYAALRALVAWRPAKFEISLDGTSSAFTGYCVAAANSNSYGGGMLVAPNALLDDGLLEVITIGEVGKLNFLFNLPKVFRGTHVSNPEVTVHRASEVKIAADRPFAVYADGDHLADLPATIRVLPRALRVIAPVGR